MSTCTMQGNRFLICVHHAWVRLAQWVDPFNCLHMHESTAGSGVTNLILSPELGEAIASSYIKPSSLQG